MLQRTDDGGFKMKRVCYEGFGKGAKKFSVENTGKKIYGKSIWVDENGKYWELNYARHAKVWAATPYADDVMDYAE